MAEMVRVTSRRNRAKVIVVPAKMARAMVGRGTHVYADTGGTRAPAPAPETPREYKRRDMEAEGEE